MIRYALVCDRRHEFESWFSNSAAYDRQVRQGLVACPTCGSAKVEKALMAPRLTRSDASSRQGKRQERHEPANQEASGSTSAEAASDAAPSPTPVVITTPREQELHRKLRELRDHLVKNAEDVGSRFPQEARKMHYGETAHRSIYGVASAQDAEAMHEEGIAFSALPVLPDERN